MGKTIKLSNDTYIANEIYSTREQIIGKWVDGKNLYRKCYQGALSNGLDTFIVSRNILNIDKLVNTNGIIYNSSVQINIGKSESVGNTNGNSRIWIDGSNILLTTGSDLGSAWSYIAVLEYTKTID